MLTKKEADHLTTIIEREVSILNGWSFSDEKQREICEVAAKKARRYLERKLKDHYRWNKQRLYL